MAATLITILLNGLFFATLITTVTRVSGALLTAWGFFLIHTVVSAIVVPHLLFSSLSIPAEAPEAVVAHYWKGANPIRLIDFPILSLIQRSFERRQLMQIAVLHLILGGGLWALVGAIVGAFKVSLYRQAMNRS
jgi:hypothetical protein